MWGIYSYFGEFMALVSYVLIFLVAIIGAAIFIKTKKKSFAWWWVSAMANLFIFLFFLGAYTAFELDALFVSVYIWPLINIGWLGYLIYRGR